MRANYHEVLGISKEASEAEIKRAYFKLVRQYSPEKEPEKFRQIREAYEHLKEYRGALHVELLIPDSPHARYMYEAAEKAEKEKEFGYMSKVCAEALRNFPDSSGFRYLLGKSQRMDGHSGKAAKTLEPLVQSNPKEALFVKELALTYDDRGFHKKAFILYKRACELGVREAEFLLDYSICCNENEQYETGRKVLFMVLEEGEYEKGGEMSQLIQALVGIYVIDRECGQSAAERVNDLLKKNVNRMAPWLEEHMEYLARLMQAMLLNFRDQGIQAKYAAYERDLFVHFQKVFRMQESKEILFKLQERIAQTGIQCDTRFGMCIKLIAEAYCESGYMDHDIEDKVLKFLKLEGRLLFIDEIPEIWEELAVLEADYPIAYEKIREFAETVKQSKNIGYIKERLLKDYRRTYKYMSVAYYAERHPEEMGEGAVIHGGEEETPYVRSSAKIGRNDPCPCGSGKKYKHCCGR